MNDKERSQWIDNDESLYNWYRATALSKAAFLKKYRHKLDIHIEARLRDDRLLPNPWENA